MLLKCPCGEVHELSAATRPAYDSITRGLPPDVAVEVRDVGCWRVPRIFIAVHGLKASELPALARRYGFEAALPTVPAPRSLQDPVRRNSIGRVRDC